MLYVDPGMKDRNGPSFQRTAISAEVSGSDDPSWTISLVQERGKTWVELRMNEAGDPQRCLRDVDEPSISFKF